MADDSIAPSGGWVNDPGSMSIYGTTGTLRVFHYTNALYINNRGGPIRVELTGRPSLGHFLTQLEDCICAITESRAPSVSGTDGLSALTTLLSACKSQSCPIYL